MAFKFEGSMDYLSLSRDFMFQYQDIYTKV